MEPRDRVLTALDHREADRVPRDLAGTRYSSIHAEAYARLRPALGLPEAEITIVDTTQGLAHVHDDVLDRFGADVALVASGAPSGYRREVVSDGEYERFVDEWGVVRARPIGGLYYESSTAPLKGIISSGGRERLRLAGPARSGPLRGHGRARPPHPRGGAPRRLRGVAVCRRDGDALPAARLRGRLHGPGRRPGPGARRSWRRSPSSSWPTGRRSSTSSATSSTSPREADDLGAQHAPLFSPRTYREIVKPLHAELISYIKSRSKARFFLHSCGAIRDLIPDLIEIGVDCLNPVQVSATGMDTATLKPEFGKDITFWGGTVDPQGTLARGTPDEVRAEARRRIGDLKPGGGFVFASIHNMQAHVPVENILALWEALDEAGSYEG